MTSVATPSTIPTDSPEARRYNRIKRWLGIADFVLGLILLLALLVTGWSGTLRDLAYSGGFQNYTLAVLLYVVMLMGIGKLLGLGLDYYGFRLEHRFQLSNQKLRAWIWDEFKGFLVGVILASIVTELLYFIFVKLRSIGGCWRGRRSWDYLCCWRRLLLSFSFPFFTNSSLLKMKN